jgi:hypothetical protein
MSCRTLSSSKEEKPAIREALEPLGSSFTSFHLLSSYRRSLLPPTRRFSKPASPVQLCICFRAPYTNNSPNCINNHQVYHSLDLGLPVRKIGLWMAPIVHPTRVTILPEELPFNHSTLFTLQDKPRSMEAIFFPFHPPTSVPPILFVTTTAAYLRRKATRLPFFTSLLHLRIILGRLFWAFSFCRVSICVLFSFSFPLMLFSARCSLAASRGSIGRFTGILASPRFRTPARLILEDRAPCSRMASCQPNPFCSDNSRAHMLPLCASSILPRPDHPCHLDVHALGCGWGVPFRGPLPPTADTHPISTVDLLFLSLVYRQPTTTVPSSIALQVITTAYWFLLSIRSFTLFRPFSSDVVS